CRGRCRTEPGSSCLSSSGPPAPDRHALAWGGPAAEAASAVLLVDLAQDLREAVEPALLQAAPRLDPLPGDPEALLVEPADADAALLAGPHEPRVLEHLEVLQYRRHGHPEGLGQRRGRDGPLAQALDDGPPRGVPEGVEDGCGGRTLKHGLNYQASPAKS